MAALAGLVVFARRPTITVAVLAAIFAVATILTRTTSGWAIAVTVIVVGAIGAVRRTTGAAAWVLVAGGVIAVVVGTAVNWAKFRHPYMFPLEHQQWTRVSSRRRLALMMNGGTITGPRFFLSSLVNYFRPDGIRFTAYFPFVSLPAEPARGYGGAIVDQAYRTGSVPAFAPLLFVFGILGVISAIRLRVVEEVRGLLIPVAGAVAAGGGVMLYGYIAHRYTADFLPALIMCGAIAVVDAGSISRAVPPVSASIGSRHGDGRRDLWDTRQRCRWGRRSAPDMAWRAARTVSLVPTRFGRPVRPGRKARRTVVDPPGRWPC